MQQELEQQEQVKNSLIRNATGTKGRNFVDQNGEIIQEAEANDLEEDNNSSAN